ncbi:MAG TPA: cytochrome c [Woeseiaceae bacterium]|nr:cytochrome c [Woeseiaceae bacterium]
MRSVKYRSTLAVTAALISVAVSPSAGADTTPQDASDYRKSVMTTLKGHIGASSMHARGLVDGQEFLVKHANGLANGVSELQQLFPAGSNVEDSDALPVIWEKPEEFAAAIDKAVAATQKFVAAAESGDKEAISSAFREVGGSCRGCHDTFRVPQD